MHSLPMQVHRHQFYLLEQHNESFKVWSASIRNNTEGKSLIMKLGPGLQKVKCCISFKNCH